MEEIFHVQLAYFTEEQTKAKQELSDLLRII